MGKQTLKRKKNNKSYAQKGFSSFEKGCLSIEYKKSFVFGENFITLSA